MARNHQTPGSRPLKDAAWLREKPLASVFALFAAAGHEVRAVGGSVRNTLLGHPVTDIDLATPVVPEEVMRLATSAGMHAHPTGIDHGTVTIVAEGHPFEVTTLRRDVETDGRRAVVAFTTDWSEDASRRDFTINAIYALADGSLYDPTGGLDDLTARRVRFIGKAEDRIREDYLRILRFFRFSAAYGEGDLDGDGLRAASALKAGIQSLSGERIGAEMLKLLVAPRAAAVIETMQSSSILTQVLGGSGHPQTFARLVAVEAALSRAPDEMARLAALSLDTTSGDVAARAIAQRLRLSNDEALRLVAANRTDSALDPGTPEDDARAQLYRLGIDRWVSAGLVDWARSTANPTDKGRRSRLELPQRWTIPALPVRGADVLALGVPAGPRVGSIVKAFEDWWIAAGFPGDPAMQQSKLRALAKQG
jgi:poly(A) polymerase